MGGMCLYISWSILKLKLFLLLLQGQSFSKICPIFQRNNRKFFLPILGKQSTLFSACMRKTILNIKKKEPPVLLFSESM